MSQSVQQLYGLDVADVVRVHAGTATDNFVVADSWGSGWFAKVYRDQSDLGREEAAIDVAEFARADGVAIPRLHRTLHGETVARAGNRALSLWEFVPDAETAESGLQGGRWISVGSTVGHLHRRLAEHPVASPALRPATDLCDLDGAARRYDELVADYRRRGPVDAFEAWAVEAALERRSLLPKVRRILHMLPPLTTQVVHGDLAAPNVLLRGNDVAAIVDFQAPSPRFVSWEIARIGCDPRTINGNDVWPRGLCDLLDAYRTAHPKVLTVDLDSVVAVGCAYMLASAYPLAEPLKNPAGVDTSLEEYARGRHDAALTLLSLLGA